MEMSVQDLKTYRGTLGKYTPKSRIGEVNVISLRPSWQTERAWEPDSYMRIFQAMLSMLERISLLPDGRVSNLTGNWFLVSDWEPIA